MSIANQAPVAAFPDPVFDSQQAYRTLISAVSYPGRIFTFERDLTPPHSLDKATAAACLTLFDFETPVWLDVGLASDVDDYLRFHCNTPVVTDRAAAHFAVVSDIAHMPSLALFNHGSLEYPDQSTTILIQVPSLRDGPETEWRGPGIRESISVRIEGPTPAFWELRSAAQEDYPLGIDIFFASGADVVGLPRSIKVRR